MQPLKNAKDLLVKLRLDPHTIVGHGKEPFARSFLDGEMDTRSLFASIHLSSAAVTTLGKVMLESATPPATKVRAADSILDHTTKAIEIEDIEARVAALEGAAKTNPR